MKAWYMPLLHTTQNDNLGMVWYDHPILPFVFTLDICFPLGCILTDVMEDGKNVYLYLSTL